MADPKVRQNAVSGFKMLLRTSPAWDRAHSRASDYSEAPMPLDDFVAALDEAMAAAFTDTAKYQAQFRELLGHLMRRPLTPKDSCFLFEVHQLSPKTVATLPPSRMGSIAEIIKAEESQRAMDEHGHISAEFSKTAGVKCPKCNKVDLSRLNLNRNGLDDERFGKQYETNMDVEDTCQCRLISAEEEEAKEKEEKERKEKGVVAVKAFATSGNFLVPDISPSVAKKAERDASSSPALKPQATPENRPTVAGQKRGRSTSKE